MTEDLIPTTEDGRKSWADNLILKFPPLSATVGFSNAETEAFINYLKMLIYVITAGQSAAAESKARTAYKKQMLDGIPRGENSLPPPITSSPAAPENQVMPGVISRIRAVIQRVKNAPGYSDAAGEQLQIVVETGNRTDPSTAKPSFKATATTSGITLDWTKGEFDGVVIESHRAAETAFTLLDKDFRPPFEDVCPPLVAGQPEKRHYRMIYLLDDAVVGVYSDEVVVTTIA